MKQNEHEAADCTTTGEGRTGGTWKGNLEYLKKHDIDNAIFENVLNLAKTILARFSGEAAETDKDNEAIRSNLSKCQEDLSAAGYASVAFECSPHQAGIPEMRWRICIICSKTLPLLVLEGIRDQWEHAIFADTMNVSSFLLAPSDPIILDAL